MSSEHALKTVVAYNKLPNTPEKQEIDRKFLASEISAFEFYKLAAEYLEEHAEPAHSDRSEG